METQYRRSVNKMKKYFILGLSVINLLIIRMLTVVFLNPVSADVVGLALVAFLFVVLFHGLGD